MYFQQSNELKLKSIFIHFFGLTFIVPFLVYLTDTNDRFIKHQMKRSLSFNLFFIFAWIILLVLESILGFITIGYFLKIATIINSFVFILYFLYMAYISLNIWNGKYLDYPFIDNYLRNKKLI